MRFLFLSLFFLLLGLQSCKVDEEISPCDTIYMIVEEMPVFPGGDEALFEFIRDKIQYPEEAIAANIEGRVIVKFLVNVDGSISDVKVQRDIGGGCGEEAVRVLELMPNWSPGRSNGEAQCVEYTMPVLFKLKD